MSLDRHAQHRQVGPGGAPGGDPGHRQQHCQRRQRRLHAPGRRHLADEGPADPPGRVRRHRRQPRRLQRQIDEALEGRLRGSVSDNEVGRHDRAVARPGRVDASTSWATTTSRRSSARSSTSWSNLANKPQDIGLRQVVVQNGDSGRDVVQRPARPARRPADGRRRPLGAQVERRRRAGPAGRGPQRQDRHRRRRQRRAGQRPARPARRGCSSSCRSSSTSRPCAGERRGQRLRRLRAARPRRATTAAWR